MPDYLDNTIFCIIRLPASAEPVDKEPQNEQHVLVSEAHPPKKTRLSYKTLPPILSDTREVTLVLRLDKSSMKDPSRGHLFGSDAGSCDIVLAKDNQGGISGLHFRVCLDYGTKEPAIMRVHSLSDLGLFVDGQRLEIAELHRGASLTIQAGSTALEMEFRDINVPLDLDLWQALRSARDDPPSLAGVIVSRRPLATPRGAAATIIDGDNSKSLLWPLQIGKGAHGGIQKATRRKDNVPCAAKKARGNEQDFLQRLKHHCVIEMLDHGRLLNTQLLFLEYASDGDLGSHLQHPNTGKPLLPEEDSRAVFQQILEGVHFIHGKGIIHRDLTPSNILIFSTGPGWQCKIADFGEAIDSAKESSMTEPTGTLRYMAMEVAASLPYDYRADIYSCGKIAFLMSTGLDSPDGIGECVTPADLVPLLRVWNPLGDLADGVGSNDYRNLVSSMLDNQVSARPTLAYCLAILRNRSDETDTLSPTELNSPSPTE